MPLTPEHCARREERFFIAVESERDSLSQVLVSDGGFAQIKGFGVHRLKAVLFLAQHPELDASEWSGRVELHMRAGSVSGAALPTFQEIRLPEQAAA